MKLRNRRTPKPQVPGSRQVVRGERPNAFSYRASRNDQDFALGRQQPREQDIRRRERIIRYWRQRLGMFVAGVALIVCVLYSLHLSASPKIVSLATGSTGYFLQSTAVYQQAATKAFDSSVFNSNKITVDTVGIQQKLQHQFPELSEVSITLPLMSHRPIVYIAPASPRLILRTAQGEYVLDSDGKALILASEVPGIDKLQLPVVIDKSGVAVQTGNVVLASTEVSFIQTVVAELTAKSVPIESLTLSAAAYQLDVKPTGVGYYVKFNMHDATALEQTGTYLAVRSRLASQNVQPGSYIDVRLVGRAYYK